MPGKSLVPVLESDVRISRDCLWWQHEGNAALRVGDFKLVSESERGGTWELYDLKHDRIESQDLAGQFPDKVRDMAAMWNRLADEYVALVNSIAIQSSSWQADCANNFVTHRAARGIPHFSLGFVKIPFGTAGVPSWLDNLGDHKPRLST